MEIDLISKSDFENMKQELVETTIKCITDNATIKMKWLRSKEVQKMLGISSSTLQNLRIRGTLPYYKVDGIIFFNNDEINEIIEKNKIILG